MAPSRNTFNCPRCGEALPMGSDRCDGCGARVTSPSAHAPGHAPSKSQQSARGGARPAADRMTSFAWLMLVVGLVVGGAVGYALRSGAGPGDGGGGGAPNSPSALMSGGVGMGGGGMGDGSTPAGRGMPSGGMGMPSDVMQMVQEYHAKLAQNPNDLQAHIGLGNLLFDSAQWEKAAEHYRKALEIDPKNGDVRVDMAIAYHNLGDDARAKQEMERVAREQPGHVNAWFNLGVVAGSMGDKKTAIRAWEQYLRLDPNSDRAPGIRDELKRLKETP